MMNDFGRMVEEAEIPRLRRYARALTRMCPGPTISSRGWPEPAARRQASNLWQYGNRSAGLAFHDHATISNVNDVARGGAGKASALRSERRRS